MTDRELMQQALEALEEINKLSIGVNPICLPAEIDGAMYALRKRLEQNDSRQLDWAKAQADHWKQHCFHLMKQLQEKNQDPMPLFDDWEGGIPYKGGKA